MKKSLIYIAIALSFLSYSFAQEPKNIIIMISDGCGINHIKAANYYQYGYDPAQKYQNWEIQSWVSTHALEGSYSSAHKGLIHSYDPEKMYSDFDYATQNPTGSAASATAISSGKKTFIKSIGLDLERKSLLNICELAKEMKKSAGVVSSVQFAHATPASFAVHNAHRENYQAIAQQMILDSKLDVIIGCGHPLYDHNGKKREEVEYKYVGGKYVWEHLKNRDFVYHKVKRDTNGLNRFTDNVEVQDCDGDGKPDFWNIISHHDDFEFMKEGKTPKRLIGIPRAHITLQAARSNKDCDKVDFSSFNDNVPSLETMSLVAINVLDNNKNGFFLMIEGGAIDWASHSNCSASMIEEQIEFNKAVDAVIEWIENNGSWEENLLIITSDHETGYLLGEGSGAKSDNSPNWKEIQNNGIENLPGMEWFSEDHTNQLVPIFIKGFGAEQFINKADEKDPVRGNYMQNNEIGETIFEIWKIK